MLRRFQAREYIDGLIEWKQWSVRNDDLPNSAEPVDNEVLSVEEGNDGEGNLWQRELQMHD